MTNMQKEEIARLQREGVGYRAIATKLSLPVDSVKSWCRRHPVTAALGDTCLQCGAALVQTPHRRKRRFCSDACRFRWWSSHPERRASVTVYQHICAFCGREFSNSRITAGYCCRACFADARRKSE